ncbi:hypothetical protein OAA85_00085 [Candidatus Pelagibacter ubique]|nr:hypothetical protein [Candidatus Pelagibacter ubique]
MSINNDDLKEKIKEANYDLEFLGQIIDRVITDGYKPLRAIGKKKAQEVIKRVINNYNSINEKLGVDDEQ